MKTLGDIVSLGRLLSFDDIKRGRGLPNRMFFRYLQLRHAFQVQFPHPITLEVHDIKSLRRTPEGIKPLSARYSILAGLHTSKVFQLFSAWQADIRTLADDNWEEGIQQYLPLMISARDRFIQRKFLHRVYRGTLRKLKVNSILYSLHVAIQYIYKKL